MPFPKKPEETFDELKARTKSNAVVTQPILRLHDTVVPRKGKGGRKKKYTPTRMRNEINRYFKWCEEKDQIPSINGMMIFLKMYPDMFYKYLQYPEFTNIMETARLHIAEWFARDVYNTKGVAAGKIAYMKNIHGWQEKIETNSNVTQTVVSVDQARAKIEALAPKLLEVLKSNTVLQQLVGPMEDAEIIDAKREND